MSKIDISELIHSKKILISLLNLLILSYFVLVSFRCLPDPTHFLVANMSLEQIKLDKLNQIINFIKTPTYNLIGFIFYDKLIYNISSIFINLIFLNLLFLFFNSFLNNSLNSLIVVCSIIFLKFVLKISAYFNYETLNFAQYILMNIDLLDNFTIRQIYGLIFVVTVYFILKDKHQYAAILIFINFFTHPNSNLIFLAILIPFYLYMFLKDVTKYRNVIIINIFLISVALIYILFKINNFDLDIMNENKYNNNFYYNSLIKDEADDFSFLWQIAYKFEQVLIVILLISLNCFLYFKNYKFDKLLYFALCPVCFFIIGCIIEYLNIYLQFELVSNLIINTQPAWKILGYSFIPFLIMFGKNLNKIEFLNIEKVKFSVLLFIILTASVFFGVGLKKNANEIKNFYSFLLDTKKVEYEDWLIALTGKENFYLISKYANTDEEIISTYSDENNIFKIKSLNKKYKNYDFINLEEEYDSYNLIKEIKRTIPKYAGIILPPYFFNSRGIFHEYLVFYLEHPDGNFAMGNINFFKIINERMETLLRTNYNQIPNKQSNLNYSLIRQKYNLVDKQLLSKIKKKYPNYSYIVSENLNIIGLENIYNDGVFAIYKF